jgi:hypothetical protein
MEDRKRVNEVAEWWSVREKDFENVTRAIEFELNSQPKAYVIKNYPGGHFETRLRVIRRFVEMENEAGERFKPSEWPDRMIKALNSLPPPSKASEPIR